MNLVCTFENAINEINESIASEELDDRQLDFILLIRTELKTYLDEYTEKTIH